MREGLYHLPHKAVPGGRREALFPSERETSVPHVHLNGVFVGRRLIFRGRGRTRGAAALVRGPPTPGIMKLILLLRSALDVADKWLDQRFIMVVLCYGGASYRSPGGDPELEGHPEPVVGWIRKLPRYHFAAERHLRSWTGAIVETDVQWMGVYRVEKSGGERAQSGCMADGELMGEGIQLECTESAPLSLGRDGLGSPARPPQVSPSRPLTAGTGM